MTIRLINNTRGKMGRKQTGFKKKKKKKCWEDVATNEMKTMTVFYIYNKQFLTEVKLCGC